MVIELFFLPHKLLTIYGNENIFLNEIFNQYHFMIVNKQKKKLKF